MLPASSLHPSWVHQRTEHHRDDEAYFPSMEFYRLKCQCVTQDPGMDTGFWLVKSAAQQALDGKEQGDMKGCASLLITWFVVLFARFAERRSEKILKILVSAFYVFSFELLVYFEELADSRLAINP